MWQGLNKEWKSLQELVTHLTVMPEMLPCTLRLPNTAHNPAYRDQDENYSLIDDVSQLKM